ncbi:LOW QUALITY PROTEIN: O-acetylhomoserine (Thiol)-lyase [Colletotrichum higginsianum IMI 349063]|uniref:O-acetylhomoserine (Thiol)-lyase n=1 Tax=Colletotrichum higginsianum (strain IMI 349063) TaxID=759273 RepID=A0A1B7XTR9_COLHI|nr:LOW QUALITY PROTEIN: O-acetylhomoserine (Thiol)-lyase [Colletotrichum higginsianum IMI 349063]OBR03162.1 LOW QUALITY PROTEIN: O-acetylhomoserine (Thiol)-lyase [Colletotrichum higginsianum IMI 349063]
MGEPIQDKTLPNGVTQLSVLPEGHDPFQPYKVEQFDTGLKYDTLQVHGGHRPDKETHARAVPIYNSVSFVFTDSAHAKRVCATEEAGYFYSRISNPTVAVFEKRAAALEGATAAVGTASGQAAIFNTIICLAGAGDNVVASINLYGGTYSLFKTLLPRLGITVKWAKQETKEEFARHIDENTKMFFVESIGNPLFLISKAWLMWHTKTISHLWLTTRLVLVARGAGLSSLVADIILHSATKWMGGHGTTVGGVIIDCGTFDWGAAGERFPRMIKKDGPMSFSYWKAFGNISFAMAMRIDILMEVGSILSPASAQQLLIGMETLSLRCERHAKNTLEVARFLESHPRIAWVNYPGLEKNQYHQNAQRYLRNGFGGVLSFGPKGGDVASKMLLNYVKVISHQTNVGDSKTLATHPWNSTHVIMSEKDRREAGITPVSLIRTYSDLSLKDLPANDNLRQAFIRFSVGTEDVRDIIEDLDQALAKLPENIVNTHDEKLEAKVTAAANGIMDTYGGGNGDVDFIDADISLSKSNVPLGRQTAVGNW